VSTLKMKWDQASGGVKAVVLVAAAVVAVLFVVKALPALIAGVGVGALIAVLFVPYWLPTIVAFGRKHPSKGAILMLNFFLGWTFIGWIVSIVWALSDNSGRAPQSVIVHTTVSPSFNVTATSGGAMPDLAYQQAMADRRIDGPGSEALRGGEGAPLPAADRL